VNNKACLLLGDGFAQQGCGQCPQGELNLIQHQFPPLAAGIGLKGVSENIPRARMAALFSFADEIFHTRPFFPIAFDVIFIAGHTGFGHKLT
jgi:hypothetical protein